MADWSIRERGKSASEQQIIRLIRQNQAIKWFEGEKWMGRVESRVEN